MKSIQQEMHNINLDASQSFQVFLFNNSNSMFVFSFLFFQFKDFCNFFTSIKEHLDEGGFSANSTGALPIIEKNMK